MDAAPIAKLPGHVSCISRGSSTDLGLERCRTCNCSPLTMPYVGGVIEHMYFTADSRPNESYLGFRKPGCSGDTRSAESAEAEKIHVVTCIGPLTGTVYTCMHI